MKKTLVAAFIVILGVYSVPAQTFESRLDGEKIKQRVKRLSADDFEGRGPGNAGSKRAADYIAAELKAAGIKPGNGKSYFQNVKLAGIKVDPSTVLRVTGRNDSVKTFKFGDDFVATTGAQREGVKIDAELMFLGYGIESSLYNWNDYGDDPNAYKGKVLLILVNDPPATEDEPNLFGGKALTYNGRWTYKYEEAARRGAAGVILIHTTQSAGYGWNVVRTSFGGERSEIFRSTDDKTPYLDLMSWMTEDAVKQVMNQAGIDFEGLLLKAATRHFRPVNTGLRVAIDLKATVKTFESPNIVGVIEGSDKRVKDEYVIYTSHWDHIGVGEPDATGDRIYNGAYDNASGVSSVIEIGKAINKLPKAQRPKRSVYFLFPTAEEQGLLGAEYFAKFPLIPLNKIAGNVNMDGVNFFGVTKDFSALGAERSGIGPSVEAVAAERKLTLMGDTRPEQGFFFRSDHFPFAKAGVPAISLRHGSDFVTPLQGTVLEFFSNYTAKYYHQPSDQYYDWWNGAAMVQNAELGMAIGMRLANASEMPRYHETDEFHAADKKRMGN